MHEPCRGCTRGSRYSCDLCRSKHRRRLWLACSVPTFAILLFLSASNDLGFFTGELAFLLVGSPLKSFPRDGDLLTIGRKHYVTSNFNFAVSPRVKSSVLAVCLGCFIGASVRLAQRRQNASATPTSKHQSCLMAALMPWRIPNTSHYQWLSVGELMLRERILMVTEYLDDAYSNAVLSMLLYLQSEDEKKPMQIYFAVPGASMKPALALYDTIGEVKSRGCKVTTVCYSLCSGMAVLLAASGTKGRRLCTPHASFRLSISGVEGSLQGQAEDIHVETSQMLRDMDRVEKEFSAITGQRIEKIRKDFRRDFYLSPAMAVKYGLIDTILAPDEGKGTKLERGIRDPWSGAVVKPVVAFGRFADPQQPRSAA